MISIYGASISDIPPEHVKFLQTTFGFKEKTQSRLKELQSFITFFKIFKESGDIGNQWRKTYANGVNISVIIAILKHFSKKFSIPLHRVCKTAYPINVYISHYYSILKPYLETMQFTNVDKTIEVEIFEDPFNDAENYIKKNGPTRSSIKYASLALASSIEKIEEIEIAHIVFYRDTEDSPVFVLFKKENYKLIPYEKTKYNLQHKEEIPKEKHNVYKLPGIQALLPDKVFDEKRAAHCPSFLQYNYISNSRFVLV